MKKVFIYPNDYDRLPNVIKLQLLSGFDLEVLHGGMTFIDISYPNGEANGCYVIKHIDEAVELEDLIHLSKIHLSEYTLEGHLAYCYGRQESCNCSDLIEYIKTNG